MTDNYYHAVLITAEFQGKDLKLRFDLDRPAQYPLPILNLELKGCRGAAKVHAALRPWLGHVADLEFDTLDGRNELEITFDYTMDEGVSISYDEADTAFDQYSLPDLQLKLETMTEAYQLHSTRYEQESTRYRQTLESLRREVRKELDHARKKATFFADTHPDDLSKSQKMQGEASAYSKVLFILDRLENVDAK